jgi:GAF domain-containing protein
MRLQSKNIEICHKTTLCRCLVNIGDSDLYRQGHEHRRVLVDELGVHTLLSVPIYSGGEAIGCINLQRTEPGPFTSQQIALIESIAAQAVIAIENVR